MRKKFTMLLALVLCAFASNVMAQTYYKPGARTTTLEAGKQYFISVATWYNGACANLLYSNNEGKLTKSDVMPSAKVADAAYLFTVVKVGDNNVYCIKNNQGKYLQSGSLESADTETDITVVPYNSVKGTVTCGPDVDACDENGNKIAYNNITDATPIVCVYENESKGWRYINGLLCGKSTAFAFYEAKEFSLFPELTTDLTAPKLYTIKNARGNVYAGYNGHNKNMFLRSSVNDAAQLFYFTAGTTEGTYKIHNYISDKKCAGVASWTADGTDWYIQSSGSGVAISNAKDLTADGGEAWNDQRNEHKSVDWYGGNDAGSVWDIEAFEGVIPTIQLSTEDNIVLHYIRSARRDSYVNFVGHNVAFDEGNLGLGSYWYFVQDEAAQAEAPEGVLACRIYNAAHATAVENYTSGFMGTDQSPAKVFYIERREIDHAGYVIYLKGESNGWHDYSGDYVGAYGLGDNGSIWQIYPSDKTVASIISEATTAKTNALNTIAAYEYADYYTYSDDAIATAKAAVEALDVNVLVNAVNAPATINAAMEALRATENGATAPVAGQYIQLKNKQYGTFLKDNGANLNGGNNASDLASIWLVEAGTGTNVKLKNVSTGKYIGEIRQSTDVAMVDAVNAKEFAFTNQTDVYAVFKEFTGGGYAYGHVAGHNVLVGWEANSNATQWIIAQVPFPVAGKYYQIKSANPDFFAKQGVEMAIYSNSKDGLLSWKALNAADKSFYWTITPNAEGKYVFQNAADNKYVPAVADDHYSMTEDKASAAAFTLSWLTLNQFNITGGDEIGTLHMREHGGGTGKGYDICSWGGGLNSSSAWTIVEVENPDLAVAKAVLADKVAELEDYVANATGAIGYYKVPSAEGLDEAIAEAEAVLNSGSSEADVYEAALTKLTAASEGLDMNIILPETGKFYRIKNNAGNAYLNAGTTGRTQFVAGVNKLASSIFYYDGKLLSYANGMYLANADGFLNYSETVGEGAEITFEASKEFGKLQIKYGENRYFHSSGIGDSNAGADAAMTSDGNYRFTIEEVTWLPVAMNATVGYATLYSPVELALSYNRVKAYTATREGNVLTLVEQTVVPANTGVILELQEGKEGDVENGYVFLQVKNSTVEEVEGNVLVGSFAKSEKNADKKVYTLQNGTSGVGFYLFNGYKMDGETKVTTYINGFRAWVELDNGSAVQALRITRGDEEGTTGIESVELGEELVIYDLAGRRVQKMEKGIYIVNGKKVVIK